MKKYLLVSIVAEENCKPLLSFSELVSQHDCEIVHMRYSQLPMDKQIIYMYIRSSWDNVAKLESNLKMLAKKSNAQLATYHTEIKESDENPYLRYMLQVFAFQSSEVVYYLTHYLQQQEIIIYETNVDTLRYTDKSPTLYTLSMQIGIPIISNMSELREGLLVLSEDMNIDLMMEPLRT